jgi:hypothetical protein
MSQTTLRGQVCNLLNEPNPVSLVLALALGLAGVGLYASNVGAEGIGQPWFASFLIAYTIGVGGLLSKWRGD